MNLASNETCTNYSNTAATNVGAGDAAATAAAAVARHNDSIQACKLNLHPY